MSDPIITIQEALGGAAALVTGIGMTLKKLGLLHIGRKANGNNGTGKCPVPEIPKRIGDDIKELKRDIKEYVIPELQATAKAVKGIEGYLDGLKDGRSAGQ